MSDTRDAELPNSAPSRGMLRATFTRLPHPGTGSAGSSVMTTAGNKRRYRCGYWRFFGSLAPPSLFAHSLMPSSIAFAICYLLSATCNSLLPACLVNLKPALALVFLLGLFYHPIVSFAQQPPEEPIRIGVFIVSTFSVDPSKGSFTVLFYIWATGPLDDPDPLSSIQFPRAVTSTLLSQNHEVRGNNRWVLKAYRCEMLNEWDLHSYPFDDHTLSLVFRLSPPDGKKFTIDLDTADSGIAQKRIEGGWKITDFQLFKYQLSYQSNFGDPADGQRATDLIVASFQMTRLPWVLFFRLMSGAYVSVLIALLGCLLKTEHPPVFSGRISMQVACLLAAVVNQREIGSAIGTRSFYSLPDALHVLCYLGILAAFLITLRSRKFNDDGQALKALRWEKRGSLIVLVVFILANIACGWWIIEPNTPPDLAQIVEMGR